MFNQNEEEDVLKKYGRDITKEAKHGKIDPVIGRDEEIRSITRVLSRRTKNNPVLIGEAGVGKTAIVEGLAYLIEKKKVPDALLNYRIIKVNTSALLGIDPVTGESKIQNLIEELKEYDNLILFIDEIHTLMGSGKDALDFANMFKPGLDRGDIKVIGATTSEEYERYILRDKAFVRRFQKVIVEEPTREQNIDICMGTLPKIEKRTGVSIRFSNFETKSIMEFLTDITSEYKRIYEIGSRYPDVTLTLIQDAFSNALFDNRKVVNIFDFRRAIETSKNIYPDIINKALPEFDTKFKKLEDESKLGTV